MQLPPVTDKTYKEAAYELGQETGGVRLDVIKLRRVPPPVFKTFEELKEVCSNCQGHKQEKPMQFLLIKEKEFPNLFDNAIVR